MDLGDAPLCGCGCGDHVSLNRNMTRWNTFIPGHNGRGEPRSEETKLKISKIHKGKTISNKVRLRISKSNRGRIISKEAIIRRDVSRLERRQINGILIRDRYCDAWGDRGYVNELRASGCEQCGLSNMMSLKLFGMQLCTHHDNGDLNCAPSDIKTLCPSCHTKIHNRLKKESHNG